MKNWIKCKIGRYCPDTQQFILKGPDDGGNKIKPQDLADALSIYHAEKFKKDQDYRKEHENNTEQK